jgi:thiol-disulfide isomerase/thioredoxin
MNPIWIASMVLQWVVILVLCLLVLSLMRQLGQFTATPNQEKNPDEIFTPFTEMPEYSVPLIGGGNFIFGGTDAKPALIVFFAPRCTACEELPPAIREFVKKYPASEFSLLAVLKRTDRAGAEDFIREHSFGSIPVALDTEFPSDLNPGGAPFGASIASGGKVAARGKPKNLTHLLEMAQAAQTMDPAVPSHSRRKHEWGESAPYWAPEQMKPIPASS